MLEEIPAGYNLYVPLQFHCSDFIGCNKGGAKYNGLEPNRCKPLKTCLINMLIHVPLKICLDLMMYLNALVFDITKFIMIIDLIH